MSHDIIADALNNIMNAKKSGKEDVVVKRFSKVLLGVLEIAKKNRYISDYKTEGTDIRIKLNEELNECRAIKPRYYVSKSKIGAYMRRYLPARGMGIMIISTNNGLMTHDEALEKQIGGCLVAYFY